MNLKKLAALTVVALIAVAGTAYIVQAHGFPTVNEVYYQPLEGEDNLVVRVSRVEFGPGAASPAHRHGGHTIVHVLEGKIVSAVDDAPDTVYGPGDSFYEPPNSLHATARNASATKPATALAIMIIDKDAYVTKLEPQPKKQ